MNPKAYIEALNSSPAEPWRLERLCQAAHEALSRWRIAREQLQVSFGFPPRVSSVVPDFTLPADLLALAPQEDSSQRRVVTLLFLSWATCPITSAVANPHEPLMELVHHGGSFSIEHGFLDLYAADGERCGIPYAYAKSCA